MSAGGRLTFSGSALSPDKTESIYIAGTRVGSVTMDRFGNFQVGVSVPWDMHAGKLSIYLIDPQYRTITTILFILGAWPEFRHDSAHLGVQTWETALTTIVGTETRRKMELPHRGRGQQLPRSWRTASCTSARRTERCTPATPEPAKSLWSYPTGGSITSTPAVDNNRVFVYSTGGVFYALNATTGKLLWQRSIGSRQRFLAGDRKRGRLRGHPL